MTEGPAEAKAGRQKWRATQAEFNKNGESEIEAGLSADCSLLSGYKVNLPASLLTIHLSAPHHNFIRLSLRHQKGILRFIYLFSRLKYDSSGGVQVSGLRRLKRKAE